MILICSESNPKTFVTFYTQGFYSFIEHIYLYIIFFMYFEELLLHMSLYLYILTP